MQLIQVEATTLPDAWFQLLYKCVDLGRRFMVDEGSCAGQDRLEFDHITVNISNPGIRPLLPNMPDSLSIPDPVEESYLNDYLPYLMTGEAKEGESYTYGQRMCAQQVYASLLLGPKNIVIEERAVIAGVSGFSEPHYLSQMDLMIWTYKNKGHRNNQMVLQVAQPEDMLLKDPPCLRHIDTRIQDGKLHFFPYFRSWDLWGGFPANLAAIQMMLEYCAEEIGVDPGSIVAASKGLHLYDYVFEIAEMVRGKTIGEFREEALSLINSGIAT